MGSQDPHRDHTPDYPPMPEPGDLVGAALNRYALADADAQRFLDGLRRFWADWRTVLEAARSGVGVAPGWLVSASQRVQHEADRLQQLGQPEWRLWAAYAQELHLRENPEM